MKGTKEFYDLQDSFERYIKDVKNCPIYIGAKIERAEKSARHFYENGKINDLFLVYMAGYSAGRLNYIQ